jgi:hypothetical protein
MFQKIACCLWVMAVVVRELTRLSCARHDVGSWPPSWLGRSPNCCAFFAFTLRLASGGLELEVRAPAEAAPMLAEVFGTAD